MNPGMFKENLLFIGKVMYSIERQLRRLIIHQNRSIYQRVTESKLDKNRLLTLMYSSPAVFVVTT